MIAESCRICSAPGGLGACAAPGATGGADAAPAATVGAGPAESAAPPDGGVNDATCVERDELDADAGDDPGGPASAGVEAVAAPFVAAGTAAAAEPVAFSPEDV
jgi:hypothetical protein